LGEFRVCSIAQRGENDLEIECVLQAAYFAGTPH